MQSLWNYIRTQGLEDDTEGGYEFAYGNLWNSRHTS
jgi:hypothetical protein